MGCSVNFLWFSAYVSTELCSTLLKMVFPPSILIWGRTAHRKWWTVESDWNWQLSRHVADWILSLSLCHCNVRNQNNSIFFMQYDRNKYKHDISTAYCTPFNNAFNSLTCNLFMNIDLCSVHAWGLNLERIDCGVVAMWRGRASGSGQMLSMPQLLTLLTFCLQRKCMHIYRGPSTHQHLKYYFQKITFWILYYQAIKNWQWSAISYMKSQYLFIYYYFIHYIVMRIHWLLDNLNV